jgi:hypothetical protein
MEQAAQPKTISVQTVTSLMKPLIVDLFSARNRPFATYETNELRRIASLFAWRSGAPEEFEVKDTPKARRP